jgi:chitin disaccharide deacetylase
MQHSQTNRLLGYPDDARLLILNADDFGMCHAINEAIFRSIREGLVHSTSLMTPCPWGLHAMHLLQENPDIPFGVHLTVISEMPLYGWRPLTDRAKVPSLLDETGNFYSLERIPEFLARARLDELEIEFRAQIETVLGAGLKPTHLDWHCLRNGGREDIFDLSFNLAKEYGFALRAYDPPFIQKLHRAGLPADDHPLLDSYDVDPDTKFARYSRMLRELPPGLSEWAVHPGLGNDEMKAVEPEAWRVRQTDFDFMMSAEAREVIRQEGITLLSYRPLQQVWQNAISKTSL